MNAMYRAGVLFLRMVSDTQGGYGYYACMQGDSAGYVYMQGDYAYYVCMQGSFAGYVYMQGGYAFCLYKEWRYVLVYASYTRHDDMGNHSFFCSEKCRWC